MSAVDRRVWDLEYGVWGLISSLHCPVVSGAECSRDEDQDRRGGEDTSQSTVVYCVKAAQVRRVPIQLTNELSDLSGAFSTTLVSDHIPSTSQTETIERIQEINLNPRTSCKSLLSSERQATSVEQRAVTNKTEVKRRSILSATQDIRTPALLKNPQHQHKKHKKHKMFFFCRFFRDFQLPFFWRFEILVDGGAKKSTIISPRTSWREERKQPIHIVDRVCKCDIKELAPPNLGIRTSSRHQRNLQNVNWTSPGEVE